jgi:hypothetical protein
MKREDFERLKEEEKKHLREIRELKQKLREAQRLQRIGRAMHDIEHSGELEGFDRSLEEVQRSAAEQEARMELAAQAAAPVEPLDVPEIDEETLQKARAADFIRQMKMSMGKGERLNPAEPAPSDAVEEEKGEEDSPEQRSEEESGPDKTIGRMTPRGK